MMTTMILLLCSTYLINPESIKYTTLLLIVSEDLTFLGDFGRRPFGFHVRSVGWGRGFGATIFGRPSRATLHPRAALRGQGRQLR